MDRGGGGAQAATRYEFREERNACMGGEARRREDRDPRTDDPRTSDDDNSSFKSSSLSIPRAPLAHPLTSESFSRYTSPKQRAHDRK